MKRLGSAGEMAKVVLIMAFDDSSFMTGNAITVDGGYTAKIKNDRNNIEEYGKDKNNKNIRC